jgi:hypothetical protein
MARHLYIILLSELLTGCADTTIASDVEVTCDLSAGLVEVEAEPGSAPYAVGCDDRGACYGPLQWAILPNSDTVSVVCDGFLNILVIWL